MDKREFDVDVDALRVTGIAAFPDQPDDEARLPLLVCIPGGGSHDAQYFDIPGFSLLDKATAQGFTVLALNRPGYTRSAPLPDEHSAFARQAEILDTAIGRLWEQYGDGRPGVVIVSHSIGSAIAVHLAAGHPTWPLTGRLTWPLLGIALNGIDDMGPAEGNGAWKAMPPGQPVVCPTGLRRQIMYGPDVIMHADAVQRATPAWEPVPSPEFLEVVRLWPEQFPTLARQVTVPVHYVLAEHDHLWMADQQRVTDLAGQFTAASSVDAAIFHGTGHNIDRHHGGDKLHQLQLEFAARCADD
ncbi:alpha/beta fold hydrolase [Streptomyces sp. NPDC008092]|uniref:alpha/beta hydrolase n=1 Tax=Streptomyces sp. NPDC008092 TaxID=3364808 RepID=UPI0036EB4576